MPGPKANLVYVFADLSKCVARLRSRCQSATAFDAVQQLEDSINDVKQAIGYVPNTVPYVHQAKPIAPPEPTLNDAYYEGNSARIKGATRESNPYDADTQFKLNDYWFAGYDS